MNPLDKEVTQEQANGITYKDRYRNYVKYFREREKQRFNMKPWDYSKIKPWDYGHWLKYSDTSNLPAEVDLLEAQLNNSNKENE